MMLQSECSFIELLQCYKNTPRKYKQLHFKAMEYTGAKSINLQICSIVLSITHLSMDQNNHNPNLMGIMVHVTSPTLGFMLLETELQPSHVCLPDRPLFPWKEQKRSSSQAFGEFLSED